MRMSEKHVKRKGYGDNARFMAATSGDVSVRLCERVDIEDTILEP